MDEHLSSPEHARHRAETISELTEAIRHTGIDAAGLEKLTAMIGRLYDMSCEFGFELMLGATGVRPKGSSGPLLLDRALIEMRFEDAEPLHEAAAREQMKQERRN